MDRITHYLASCIFATDIEVVRDTREDILARSFLSIIVHAYHHCQPKDALQLLRCLRTSYEVSWTLL